MEPESNQPPLICIVGETASGKTALAIELARRFGGEIIAADSRTIYKGMDIGTAKPTADEQRAVRHHLLDITTPDRPLTVAEYKALAEQKITEISSRGKVPFLVGGTGLYVDSVLFDYSFSGKADEAVRARLQRLSVEELQDELTKRGIALPANARNPRHLIRALETGGSPASKHELRKHTLVLGVEVDRQTLKARVAKRTDEMIAAGLAREVARLVEIYGAECQPLQTIGYQELIPYLAGTVDLGLVREAIINHTMQYAKRQRTWFRRNNSIHYIRSKEESVELVTTLLNKVPIAN